MMKELKNKLETAFEIREAYEVATVGVPEAYEEARIHAIFARLRYAAENPAASREAADMHAKRASYEVHLGKTYHKADIETIKQAARDMATVVTSHGSYKERRPNMKRAVDSIMRMINEHKSNTASSSSRIG